MAPPATVLAPPQLPPPLKWAGGKRWQLPYLAPLWRRHSHRRLVEPFCGGLAVALGLAPAHAVLNDINPHLISFYEWLRRGLRITIALVNDESLFYQHRQRFNALVADGQARSVEAASLFYYLNRTGYNGLCRFNRAGEFNVPFGSYKTIAYARDFTAYRAALAKWHFALGDFAQLEVEKSDLIFADPPYDVEFRQYAPRGFSWDDQVRTAEWLARHRGPAILVNQATARIVDLYTKLGYELQFLAAPRRISCTGDRSRVREVLATRNM